SPRIAEDLDAALVGLEEVLAQSDFLSLHASLTPETEHLINEKSLAKMKPGVRIVNCSRGEMVNEADLLAALESGHVGGAGLDVFEIEPPPPGSPGAKLLAHPRVVATPHIAGSTEEAQESVGIGIAEQISEYLRDGISRSAVNLPPVSAEEFKKLEPYIQLGEKEGSFLAQMATGRMDHVRISYDGGLAELNTHLVKSAVLKGILNVILSEKANLINAGTIAEERGIVVEELRSTRRVAVSNSLGVALRTAGDSPSILGMVGMGGSLRILGINDIDVEAPLQGILLLIKNQDVPGVIGRVGTILGNGKVNIANFALGRAPGTDQAIGVVNVDQPVPEAVLAEIRAVPAIGVAHLIQL
ncbi:MAG: NAD(P)-dependent oxidoreductase, partial [Acidobacteria bacterium]|nr:NAD(P)-dependent oxidoreductase [Acidobacteriota bacterium]